MSQYECEQCGLVEQHEIYAESHPDGSFAGRYCDECDLSDLGGELGPRLARRDLEFLAGDPFGLPVAELVGFGLEVVANLE